MDAKELNIFDGTPREIVCTRAEKEDGYFPNASKVEKGKIYHLVKVDVGSYSTDVYLAEFPGRCFNSVQFGEV